MSLTNGQLTMLRTLAENLESEQKGGVRTDNAEQSQNDNFLSPSKR